MLKIHKALSFYLGCFLALGLVSCDLASETAGVVSKEYVTFQVDESDFRDGMLRLERKIKAETFLNSGFQALGREPQTFELVSVSLSNFQPEDNEGLISWSDVFKDAVDVYFEVPNRESLFLAASLKVPYNGFNPIHEAAGFPKDATSLRDKVQSGQFSVVLKGYESLVQPSSFSFKLRVELEFMML